MDSIDSLLMPKTRPTRGSASSSSSSYGSSSSFSSSTAPSSISSNSMSRSGVGGRGSAVGASGFGAAGSSVLGTGSSLGSSSTSSYQVNSQPKYSSTSSGSEVDSLAKFTGGQGTSRRSVAGAGGASILSSSILDKSDTSEIQPAGRRKGGIANPTLAVSSNLAAASSLLASQQRTSIDRSEVKENMAPNSTKYDSIGLQRGNSINSVNNKFNPSSSPVSPPFGSSSSSFASPTSLSPAFGSSTASSSTGYTPSGRPAGFSRSSSVSSAADTNSNQKSAFSPASSPTSASPLSTANDNPTSFLPSSSSLPQPSSASSSSSTSSSSSSSSSSSDSVYIPSSSSGALTVGRNLAATTIPCPDCGRTFKRQAYIVHQRVCKKVFRNKREVFDSAQARTEGLDVGKKSGEGDDGLEEGEVDPADGGDGEEEAETESGSTTAVRKSSASSSKKSDDDSASSAAAKDWKESSLSLREQIKAAKNAKSAGLTNTGIDMGRMMAQGSTVMVKPDRPNIPKPIKI